MDIPQQLKKLAELRDAGVLSEAEFVKKKTELLARWSVPVAQPTQKAAVSTQQQDSDFTPVGFAAVVIMAPLFLIMGNAVALRTWSAIWPLIPLFIVGAVAVTFILLRPKLRTKTSKHIFRVLWSHKGWRFGILAGIAIAEAGALVLGFNEAAERRKTHEAISRVESALAATDPCAVQGLAKEDIEVVSTHRPTLKSQCNDVLAACVRNQSCKTLKAVLKSRSSKQVGSLLAKHNPALVRRIITNSLVLTDLKRTPETLPCKEHPQADVMWKALVKAASNSKTAWVTIDSPADISKPLLEALAALKPSLSPSSADALHRRVESLVKDKLSTATTSKELLDTVMLCALEQRFGIDNDKVCNAAREKWDSLQEKERVAKATRKTKDAKKEATRKAKEKREDAKDEAKTRRCEGVQGAVTRCYHRCYDRYGYSVALYDTCSKRCERAGAARGCP